MNNDSKNKKDIPITPDGDKPIKGKKKIKKISKNSKNSKVSKTTKKIPEVSAEDLELKAFLEDIAKSVKANNKITKQIAKDPIAEIDPQLLVNILSEYMNSFALLGYDINGKRIVIKWTPEDRDEDSVIELIRCVFMQIAQNGYGPIGG